MTNLTNLLTAFKRWLDTPAALYIGAILSLSFTVGLLAVIAKFVLVHAVAHAISL